MKIAVAGIAAVALTTLTTLAAAVAPGGASAQTLFESFIDRSDLLSVNDDTEFSGDMRSLSRKGYALSDGSWQSFQGWYGADVPEVSLDWITRVDDTTGVLWGINTGERGEKYRIHPAFRIGFLKLFPFSERSQISLSVVTTLGGRLSESPCVANYGALGSYTVNCRLAATVMRPADTLDYLFDTPPEDRTKVSIRYTLAF